MGLFYFGSISTNAFLRFSSQLYIHFSAACTHLANPAQENDKLQIFGLVLVDLPASKLLPALWISFQLTLSLFANGNRYRFTSHPSLFSYDSSVDGNVEWINCKRSRRNVRTARRVWQ